MEYQLNISKICKKYPNGLHWALVSFGRCTPTEATLKAGEVVTKLGRDGFVYHMNRVEPITSTSWVV